MTNLQSLLLEQTVMLKDEYVAKTIEFAKNNFEHSRAVNRRDVSAWCSIFGLESVMRHNMPCFPNGFYNTRDAKEMSLAKNKASKVVRMGLEGYVKSEEANAVAHYENSIAKLAARIEKKGLNQDALTVVTGRVGINIETTITDGVKMVKAFTIVAHGPIVRPHYRYLVK